MVLPVGVSTATVTVGSDMNFHGTNASLSVTVKPVLGGNANNVVWSATGQSLDDFITVFPAVAGSQASFVVPHVDQAGFINGQLDAVTMWAYTVEITATLGKETKTRRKNFQPLAGQSTIDLDLVADGSITGPVSAPIPDVLSVNGDTGVVIIDAVSSAALAAEVVARTAADDLRPPRIGGTTTSAAPIPTWFAKDYGATGNGIADDRTAMHNACLAAAAGGGGVVDIGNLHIRLGSLLEIPGGVVIDGRNGGRIIQGHTGTALIRASGSMPVKGSPTTTVTADAIRGATSVTVASTSGLAVNDVLLIGSNVVVGSGFIGEYVRVKAVTSGTVLELHGIIRDAYLVSDSAAIWKPVLLDGVGIRNVTIVNPTPATSVTQLLTFYACRNPIVENVQVYGADNPAVALAQCWGGSVDRVLVQDSQDDGASSRFGYGVLIQGATEGVVVSNSNFNRVRHGFTTDSYAGHCGAPRRIIVSACTVSESTLGGFDTHAAASDILFIGCVANGCRSDGVQIRSSNTRFIGGMVTSCSGKAFLIQGTSTKHIYGVAVMGTVIRHIANHGMQLSYVEGTVIDGNDMDGVGNNAIDVLQNADRVVIMNNRFFNTGKGVTGASQGVQFEATSTGSGHIVTKNLFGNWSTGDEPGITPGGMRHAVFVGAATTAAVIADNLAVGLITAMLSDSGTGTLKSNNRQLDKNEAAVFPNGLGTKVKAGTPSDADFVSPVDGLVVADSTGSKIWVRIGGAWKSVAVA